MDEGFLEEPRLRELLTGFLLKKFGKRGLQRADAEDVVQEALLKLHLKGCLTSGGDRGGLGIGRQELPLARKLANGLAIDRYRKSKTKKSGGTHTVMSFDADDFLEVPDSGESQRVQFHDLFHRWLELIERVANLGDSAACRLFLEEFWWSRWARSLEVSQLFRAAQTALRDCLPYLRAVRVEPKGSRPRLPIPARRALWAALGLGLYACDRLLLEMFPDGFPEQRKRRVRATGSGSRTQKQSGPGRSTRS